VCLIATLRLPDWISADKTGRTTVMARIQLNDEAQAERVMDTVRETFESRDYHWERTGQLTATASEGGRPVRNLAVGVSQRLRVAVRFDAGNHRLVLRQETLGAAYIANGGPVIYLWLSRRFRKMTKAVRDDLAAAALH
jgi:hypothetical protein